MTRLARNCQSTVTARRNGTIRISRCHPESPAAIPSLLLLRTRPRSLRGLMNPVAQPVAPIQRKRNWLDRWLFPDSGGQDKRSGARQPAPGLVAHFWTGGPPKSHPVRNISATGMNVVTEERWYQGTQILITLTKTLEDGPRAERSITVVATAVRWGDDGVGLEFVRNTAKKARRQEPLLSDGADHEQLGQFMEQFGVTDGGPGSRGTRKR